MQENLVSLRKMINEKTKFWMYEQLIYWQVGADIDATQFNNQTPLFEACWGGYTGTVKLLVDAGQC